MKVLISDPISQECIDILKDGDKITVDVNTGQSPEELKSSIKEYSGIVIRSATKLTADVLAEADNLKVIGRAGVGLDNYNWLLKNVYLFPYTWEDSRTIVHLEPPSGY